MHFFFSSFPTVMRAQDCADLPAVPLLQLVRVQTLGNGWSARQTLRQVEE